jgi:hypothetical protein
MRTKSPRVRGVAALAAATVAGENAGVGSVDAGISLVL